MPCIEVSIPHSIKIWPSPSLASQNTRIWKEIGAFSSESEIWQLCGKQQVGFQGVYLDLTTGGTDGVGTVLGSLNTTPYSTGKAPPNPKRPRHNLKILPFLKSPPYPSPAAPSPQLGLQQGSFGGFSQPGLPFLLSLPANPSLGFKFQLSVSTS